MQFLLEKVLLLIKHRQRVDADRIYEIRTYRIQRNGLGIYGTLLRAVLFRQIFCFNDVICVHIQTSCSARYSIT